MDELLVKGPRGHLGRVRFRIAVLVAALAVAGSYGGAAFIGTRRAAVTSALAERAAAAVHEARHADAMTWAPEELLQAEASLRQATTDQRVQLAHLWPLPNLSTADAGYRDAIDHSTRAVALTTTRRDTARAASAERVALADESVARSQSLAEHIHLDSSRRGLLTQASLALYEARVYHREAEYGEATVQAARARSLADRVQDLAVEKIARYADQEVLERWRRWKADAIAWSEREGRPAIVVEKEAHQVSLYSKGKLVKAYRADMGFNWVADKQHSGDGATPEGRYRIVARKSGGATIYYRALLLDYPNPDDRREFTRARRNGELPPSAVLGGLIEIHGEGGRGRDWTHGCVALSNPDIDDLFARVEIGTPVTIVGSAEPGALAAIARPPAVKEGQK